MNKPMPTDYDKDPFPNPSPKQFHGSWTDWPELHNQKSLDKKAKYRLQDKSPIPKGGQPFFVELTHPTDGGNVTCTNDPTKARSFNGAYLLSTMWEWELKFNAIQA